MLPLHVDRCFSIARFAEAVGGKLEVRDNKGDQATGIALDTRALQSGDIFFALKAVRDGHEFIHQAKEKGALAAVVEKPIDENLTSIQVSDSLQALHGIARSERSGWGGKVVAISGSNGKTTTKEMTYAVLNAGLKAAKSPGTWNNHLGVPLSLLATEKENEVVVLEMGMNAFGELTTLCSIAQPDVSVLTSIGPAHLEKFGTVEAIARAKKEIFTALDAKGTAVINLDDPWIKKSAEDLRCRKVTVSSVDDSADVYVRRHSLKPDREGFALELRFGDSDVELETGFTGAHNLSNLLCALGAAFALGVSSNRLQEGVSKIRMPEMRLQRIHLQGDILILNDCYNANPASMAAGLEVGRELGRARSIAVLGDMMELGEFAPRAHRDVGMQVARNGYDFLFVLGQFRGDFLQGAIQGGMDESRLFHASDHDALAEKLLGTLQTGDLVFVKASRAMKMEKIVEKLVSKKKRSTN